MYLQNSFFQGIVNMAHGKILKAVRDNLPEVKAALQSKIDGFNLLLKNHNETTFLFSLLDPLYPINMTNTHSPIVDGANNLITLSFDGRIYDSVLKTNHGKLPSAIPQRFTGDKSNSQQIFIHQSMLSSLFYAVSSKYFPFDF